MKKLALILLFAGIHSGICTAQDSYKLTGKLPEFKDGAKVFLQLAATHQEEKTVEIAEVKNGQFQATGQLSEPTYYRLMVQEPGDVVRECTIMLEKGDITLEAYKSKEKSGGAVYSLANVKVTGSQSDKELHEKVAFRDSLNAWYKAMYDKYNDLSVKIGQARASGNKQALQELEATQEYKDFAAAEKEYFTSVETKSIHAFLQNKNTYWGPFLMLYSLSYFVPNDPQFCAIYDQFSDEAKNSQYGKILNNQLHPVGLLGQQVPTFALPDTEGKEKSAADLLKGKKLLLIDFWASWCMPCRKAIPQIKEIYSDLAGKGLEIVSISVDKKEADWRKALDKEQLPWFNLQDTKSVFGSQFKGKAIPAFFLVDANGTIVGENLAVGDLRAKIESHLTK